MFNALWTDAQQTRANEDGWALIRTVDSGKPVSTAYLELFQFGPRFNTREAAIAHVMVAAKTGSKFHQDALAARVASRLAGRTTTKRK